MDRIPYVMLVLALTLAYFPKIVIVGAMLKQKGRYDNAHPRVAYTELTGMGARALGAHLNGLEAFPAFATGVLACLFTGVDQGWVSILATAFVVARVVYVALYLGNIPTARSAVWALGFFITLALLVLPIVH